MKRLLLAVLLVLLAAALAACTQPTGDLAPTGTLAPKTETNIPAPSEAPTPVPSPTPEPKPYAPIDIFGSEFNPYSGAAFPDTFYVYGASFDIGIEKRGGKPHFILSMTASGNSDNTIEFLATLAGLSEDEKVARSDEYNGGGFCEFQSKDGTTFTVRKTNPDDDRYAYVDGCHIDICFNLTDKAVPPYISLVRDNFNVNALAAVSEYFDTTPMFEECYFAVNLHKKVVSVDTRYAVADLDAVERNMAEKIKWDWYDAQNGKMGFSYGILNIEYVFDSKGGNIYISERSSEMKSALYAYVEPEVSLTKLGFGFDQDGVCGVYEQHEPHYMNVAIHKPEWGEFTEDWNIEYLDEVNGYGLRITYNFIENRYHITVDKNKAGAAFDYLPAVKEYTGEYPDMDTVKRLFNDAFGSEGDDFYEKPLAYFEQLLHERFGMNIAELYALPIK